MAPFALGVPRASVGKRFFLNFYVEVLVGPGAGIELP